MLFRSDAVGVTKSKKSETRTLERKPSVSLKQLMMDVALGARDEDTLTSLANRLIRLNSKMSNAERKVFAETVGDGPGVVAERLLAAFDEDVLRAKAREQFSCDVPSPEQMAQVKKAAADDAVKPFHRPEVRECIENIRRSHDQLLDGENIDKPTFVGFDSTQGEQADRVIKSFRAFIEENRDEIIGLRILYHQTYRDRPMVLSQLQALYEKLKAQGVTGERLWDCYAIRRPEEAKPRSGKFQLADLISLVRFEMGESKKLIPFVQRVDANYKAWIFRRNAGAVHFTEEQTEWLRLIKDHIAVSLSIEPDDLELSPFDHKGGLGRFYEVFGEQYEEILMEMNIELVA